MPIKPHPHNLTNNLAMAIAYGHHAGRANDTTLGSGRQFRWDSQRDAIFVFQKPFNSPAKPQSQF
jgi:hypothetical protein